VTICHKKGEPNAQPEKANWPEERWVGWNFVTVPWKLPICWRNSQF